MKTKGLFFSLLAIPLLTAGCASIMDGGYTKSVRLDSNPEGAKVTISATDGSAELITNTPAKVNLPRASQAFQGVAYKITFEKPGYFSYETHVESTIDPWYFGNFLFGGLIGGILVDPSTGAMYTLSPRKLSCNLTPAGAPATVSEVKAVPKN